MVLVIFLPFLSSMHIHAFSCIYMYLHAYTCIYLHIPAYTCIYMHFPESSFPLNLNLNLLFKSKFFLKSRKPLASFTNHLVDYLIRFFRIILRSENPLRSYNFYICSKYLFLKNSFTCAKALTF